MNIQRLSRSELIDISAQEEIIKATAQQIIKDFAEFGFEINFSGNTANFYTELFSQMEESVKDLIANQQTKFYSFLYRIDISNKEMALYEQEMAGQPKSETEFSGTAGPTFQNVQRQTPRVHTDEAS